MAKRGYVDGDFTDGWFRKQQTYHHRYRMTIDDMLRCWLYATMLKDRKLTLSDIGAYHGLTKEGVRLWFDRGLPGDTGFKLDEAISALRPLAPPTPEVIREFEHDKRQGWRQMLKDDDLISSTNAGGQGIRRADEQAEKQREHAEKLYTQRKAKRERKESACLHGHPWTPLNTYHRPSDGRRACRICMRDRQDRRIRKAKSK